MRTLRPVDVVVEGLEVQENGFITDPSMDGPVWTNIGMSQVFFGRRHDDWLMNQIKAGHLVLDNQPLPVMRSATSDRRMWRLYDVERLALALNQSKYLDAEQLVHVLIMVRHVAAIWGYLPPLPLQTHVEPYDPNRKDPIVAAQEQEEFIDDLDGSENARERSFALGGVQYRVDLTEEHWNDLVTALAPYVKVARRGRARTDRDPASRENREQIRRWAREHGYKVGERGKIPIAVQRAYMARTGR